MSVVIKIYSNHGLSFDSYPQGIELMEQALQIKLRDSLGRDKKITRDETQINYFTNHPYFSKRFDEEGWPLWIFTDYALCQQVRIYRHFIEFQVSGKVNLKTHLWRDLVSKKDYEQTPAADKKHFDNALEEWNKTRSYYAGITKKLGGDTILYLNDGSDDLIPGEELIWEGGSFTAVIEILSKTSKPYPYHNLENNRMEFTNANWFIEKI